jgi:UDP-N-acetylglucosamine:LPS N-acetylglucosamine transferase
VDSRARIGTKRRTRRRVDVLLVANAGGHILQLHSLRNAWRSHSRVWVSADKSDVRSLLSGEEVYFGHSPTVRNLPNLARNTVLAWRLITALRPKVIVSTGAGMAVPFCWIGRLFGTRIAYVESLARVAEPSLALRTIRPIADVVYVQWEDLLRVVPEARYEGSVFPQ